MSILMSNATGSSKINPYDIVAQTCNTAVSQPRPTPVLTRDPEGKWTVLPSAGKNTILRLGDLLSYQKAPTLGALLNDPDSTAYVDELATRHGINETVSVDDMTWEERTNAAGAFRKEFNRASQWVAFRKDAHQKRQQRGASFSAPLEGVNGIRDAAYAFDVSQQLGKLVSQQSGRAQGRPYKDVREVAKTTINTSIKALKLFGLDNTRRSARQCQGASGDLCQSWMSQSRSAVDAKLRRCVFDGTQLARVQSPFPEVLPSTVIEPDPEYICSLVDDLTMWMMTSPKDIEEQRSFAFQDDASAAVISYRPQSDQQRDAFADAASARGRSGPSKTVENPPGRDVDHYAALGSTNISSVQALKNNDQQSLASLDSGWTHDQGPYEANDDFIARTVDMYLSNIPSRQWKQDVEQYFHFDPSFLSK